MFEIFNYNKSNDQDRNDIVEAIFEATKSTHDKQSYKDSSEKKKSLNTAIGKYVVSGTKFEEKFATEGLDIFRNPLVVKSSQVKENFESIITEVINAVAPAVANAKYKDLFAEVRQIGWGQTARFNVKSNGLFKVNEIAEGINRGVLQPLYNDEFTVNTGKVEIATSIDWYAVAAGVFDWGDFALKVGVSFDGYVFLKILAAMTSATTQIGSAYEANGIDTTNWSTLCSRVSAANGGIPVYGLGTLATLNQIYPETTGLQQGLGSEIVKDGYLGRYLGTGLIAIDQIMVPGTTNSTATLAIPDNKIYITSAYGDKPVKLVYEGDSVVVESIPTDNPDRTYGMSIQMKIGVAAVVGSKFGTITLAS